jgi:hypothetical protein
MNGQTLCKKSMESTIKIRREYLLIVFWILSTALLDSEAVECHGRSNSRRGEATSDPSPSSTGDILGPYHHVTIC